MCDRVGVGWTVGHIEIINACDDCDTSATASGIPQKEWKLMGY